MKLSKEANYGNWVPANMMRLLWTATAILVAAAALLLALVKPAVVGILVGVAALAALAMSVYMQLCRNAFDFNKGGMMGKVHQFLVDRFPWQKACANLGLADGRGTILDIGCGAAALTVRCAKAFPNATLVGMDYWGTEWSYAKEQCERNAQIEGVSQRLSFQKGDAAKLDFADETFDGAVSNFVFHEVRSQPDKRKVVREALRVVKKGGAFAIQDMFGQKPLYGDMNDFCEQLKKEGAVREIHYVPNIEKQDFVPAFVTAPWMIRDAGLIYGIR